jgi:hypothetical protein
VAQVTECLPTKRKALSPSPSTVTTTNNNKKGIQARGIKKWLTSLGWEWSYTQSSGHVAVSCRGQDVLMEGRRLVWSMWLISTVPQSSMSFWAICSYMANPACTRRKEPGESYIAGSASKQILSKYQNRQVTWGRSSDTSMSQCFWANREEEVDKR